jgi:hypothetical protein
MIQYQKLTSIYLLLLSLMTPSLLYASGSTSYIKLKSISGSTAVLEANCADAVFLQTNSLNSNPPYAPYTYLCNAHSTIHAVSPIADNTITEGGKLSVAPFTFSTSLDNSRLGWGIGFEYYCNPGSASGITCFYNNVVLPSPNPLPTCTISSVFIDYGSLTPGQYDGSSKTGSSNLICNKNDSNTIIRLNITNANFSGNGTYAELDFGADGRKSLTYTDSSSRSIVIRSTLKGIPNKAGKFSGAGTLTLNVL